MNPRNDGERLASADDALGGLCVGMEGRGTARADGS
jgi:hypothetical protein